MPPDQFHARARRAFWRRAAAACALAIALGGARAATIRVGYDAVLEPIAYVDDEGRPMGFAADYVRAVAQRAGFEVTFMTGRKGELQTAFREGRIDVVATLVRTPERAKVMDFSLPYLSLQPAVFARRGGPAIRSVADFAGRKVAVSRGNVTHDYLLAHPEWGAQLELVDSTEAALRAVQSGACDAAINVGLVAEKIIRERKLDQVVRTAIGLPGLEYKYHMAVRKGDEELLRRLGEAQLAVHEGGDYAEIYERWIGPLHTGIAWRELRPLVVPAALVVLLAGIALAWQRRNLTALSRQAAALRRSEERLNLVLQSGRHSLWDWNIAENRVERGPLLASLLGYNEDEIAEGPLGLRQVIHPDDQPKLDQVLARIARPGVDGFVEETRMRAKSGEWRWMSTAGRVVERDRDGRPLRAVGTHTDITERKEAEEAVRRLNHELELRVGARTAELAARVAEVEQLNQELESFSYSVSHDLRAPLRNITGFIELLVRRNAGRLDAESDRFVGTVTSEARRLGQLIDDLLALSRVGRVGLNLGRVEPAELVAEARAELALEIGARPIEWRIGALPAVRGDRSLLRQVVQNLLSNAVKFTRPRDPAVIEVGALPPGDDRGMVTCFVRDNGAGFNPKYVDRLFGVFQRLHNQRDFEGTGIGLANVNRIIVRHGGRVWAEGELDRGATFYFTLVAAEA